MDLDESQKFLLYTVGVGLLLLLLACVMQFCFIPGSECAIPFVTQDRTDQFIYNSQPYNVVEDDVNYAIQLETNLGTITIDLFEENAPTTVNNIIFLTKEGYYDGVLVHLLVNDLIFQTGSRNSFINSNPADDGLGNPGYFIRDEINWDSLDINQRQRADLRALGFSSTPGIVSKPIKKYSVMMANSGTANTNGSQFLIVTADSGDTRLPNLVGKHTVFGQVIGGFDVVDAINNAQTPGEGTFPDKPIDDIVIEQVILLEDRSNVVEEIEEDGDNQNFRTN